MNKKELWLRLKDYHFNNLVSPNLLEKITQAFGGVDASTKAFADKIARKHGGSKAFALKAVLEYKKFVFLGIISDFQVTPSKYIDIVWHEHILFTNGYRDFCENVIEYTFEHHPELMIVEEETGRYNAQYLSTLELYIKEFGKLPPTAIWEITKFDKEKILDKLQVAKQKKSTIDRYYSYESSNTDIALFESFSESEINGDTFSEFGGFDGGSADGAGASGSWGDASDAGDGSGDGSSDGGSSCSSSCGGGGCGGGD
jgi:hypothetical protein